MKRSLIACALALTACATTPTSKAPEKAEPTAADFYPLTPGTSWKYEMNQLGASRTLDVTILKKNEQGFTEDSTGAQFLVDAYGVRDQKRYLLRNPVVAGTKWTNVVSVSSVERYAILGAGQPCESPAGKWENCAVVESRNRIQEGLELVNEMTFAPGVGIVRLSIAVDQKGKLIPQSTLVLLEFTPPKG